MTTWHGYPQLPDAHPDRPWWRWSGGAWTRSDGRIVAAARPAPPERPPATVLEMLESQTVAGDEARMLAEMAQIDREHPLPAPAPLVGQVWVWPDGNGSVDRIEAAVMGIYGDGIYVGVHGHRYRRSEWPIDGAVLVAGPGAPWQTMEERR